MLNRVAVGRDSGLSSGSFSAWKIGNLNLKFDFQWAELLPNTFPVYEGRINIAERQFSFSHSEAMALDIWSGNELQSLMLV